MQKLVQKTLISTTEQLQPQPKLDIQIYDAFYKEDENIYVDNLDIYYTKTNSPCLHCKCNEEYTMSIVYTEKSKFKAHITTKKHKQWLKNKAPPAPKAPVQPVEQSVQPVEQPDTPVAQTTTAPRYHAPRVSELRYFMVWTIHTHQTMREIEERLPIVV